MWPRVVDVLARIAETPAGATAAPRVLELLVLRHFGLRSRILLERLGPAGFAKHLATSVALRAGLIGRAPQPATPK